MQLFEQTIGNLYEALNINPTKKESISFIGAGGKTTTMFRLARELKSLGKRVLVTTSTAIYYPSEGYINNVLVLKDNLRTDYLSLQKASITVIGREVSKEGKLLGLDKSVIDKIYKKDVFDYILIEGDGSKGRPIKAPASYEPVIPDITSITIGIVGLDSIGKGIDDKYVHRPNIFRKVTDSFHDEIITEEILVKLVKSKEGLFKSTPEKSKKYLLLNKAEGGGRKKSAYKVRDLLRKGNFEIDGVIISSMFNNEILRID